MINNYIYSQTYISNIHLDDVKQRCFNADKGEPFDNNSLCLKCLTATDDRYIYFDGSKVGIDDR